MHPRYIMVINGVFITAKELDQRKYFTELLSSPMKDNSLLWKGLT